jgi:hypothetical protein
MAKAVLPFCILPFYYLDSASFDVELHSTIMNYSKRSRFLLLFPCLF